MKIVLVSNSAPTMWAFRERLIRELIALEWDIVIVAPPDEMGQVIVDAGASFFPLEMSRSGLNPISELLFVFKLRRLLRQLRPDIVHGFQLKGFVYSSIAGFIARVPVRMATITGMGYVFTAEGFRVKAVRQVVRSSLFLGGLMTHLLIASTETERSELKKSLPSWTKTSVQSGGEGVDVQRFSATDPGGRRKIAWRNSVSIPENAFVILFVGRMLKTKGVVELVESLRLTRETYPDTLLVLVGSVGDDNPAAISETEFDQLASTDGVRYVGPMSDVREAFVASDVFALPSHREGMPTVVMEASAMGIPVVSTDVTGCRDAVIDGETGLLVPLNSPSSLRDAFIELHDSAELRKRLGAGGRKLAESTFDDRQIVKSIIEHYQRMAPSG
jgi:glycosyltransferase involved in cell wall biosynthesis